jgi:L-ascorbate metabolism protein UlaG (beta-lactamase superfamily)
MPIQIEFLGWTAFRLVTENGTKIVVDPSLEGDPVHGVPPGVMTPKELSDADVIVVTHAAPDHDAQVGELMKVSKAILFCGKDVATKVREEGFSSERVLHMMPGWKLKMFDFSIKALWACHMSFSKLEDQWLTGTPLSFILDFGRDGKIFFGGDTALGPHIRFYGEFYRPDLAVLGIGGVGIESLPGQYKTDLFPDEAVVATKWLNVKSVIPVHYLANEGEEFKQELVKQDPGVQVAMMKPGEKLYFTVSDGLFRGDDSTVKQQPFNG